MSSDGMDERRKAMEEEFFHKKNQEALERLTKRNENEGEPRKSPITGEPMEQLTLGGVVIDRCPTSNGIWLDAGELEEIMQTVRNDEHTADKSAVNRFLSKVFNLNE